MSQLWHTCLFSSLAAFVLRYFSFDEIAYWCFEWTQLFPDYQERFSLVFGCCYGADYKTSAIHETQYCWNATCESLKPDDCGYSRWFYRQPTIHSHGLSQEHWNPSLPGADQYSTTIQIFIMIFRIFFVTLFSIWQLSISINLPWSYTFTSGVIH